MTLIAVQMVLLALTTTTLVRTHFLLRSVRRATAELNTRREAFDAEIARVNDLTGGMLLNVQPDGKGGLDVKLMAPAEMAHMVPDVLRQMADQIEATGKGPMICH